MPPGQRRRRPRAALSLKCGGYRGTAVGVHGDVHVLVTPGRVAAAVGEVVHAVPMVPGIQASALEYLAIHVELALSFEDFRQASAPIARKEGLAN